jgi:hypothetical protein
VGDGGTAYRRPSCGLVPRRVLLGTPFFRVGNRKQKPLGGPGTGSTPFLEPIVPPRRGLGDQHIRGVQRSAEMPLRPGKPGARSQPVCEAVQEVAPPHARPRSRSARIGSFCYVVAAPVWVQAWVGAVGRVRNASPICNDSMLPNRGACPCFTRTFVNARLAEVRLRSVCVQGAWRASK